MVRARSDWRRQVRCIATACWLVVGCGRTPELSDAATPGGPNTQSTDATCPADPIPAERAPEVLARHRDTKTWIEQAAQVDPDTVLLPLDAIVSHNDAQSETPGAWRDPTSVAAGLPELVDASIDERMRYMQQQLAVGRFKEDSVGSLSRARLAIETSTPVDHQRLIVEEVQLHCVPLADGLFKDPPDPDFDRNACASLHPGERIRVLRRADGGKWLHVHAGHTVGWIHEASVTPRLSRDQIDQLDSERFVVPLHDAVRTRDGSRIRLGTRAPLVGQSEETYRVLVPDRARGLREDEVDRAGLYVGTPPLTRRRVLEVAFSQLGDPYGWGGREGHRDCSRFLRDLMATFGLQLGRHSGVQAEQGTHTVDLEGMSDAAKFEAIAAAAARGVVFLYMPGHIMLYVGNDRGRRYAISSISEWLEPCGDGRHTVHRIDRVEVTTLELGRDTERTAFIERLTRLAVFAAPPPEPPASAQAVGASTPSSARSDVAAPK